PEEIFLRGVEVVGGDAAIVGEVAVDVCGPGVLCHDGDVDDAVMRRSGGDRGALEKIELPEISLRLLQLCRIERIAFLEEQETPQERHPSLHRQDVGPSIEAAVPRLSALNRGMALMLMVPIRRAGASATASIRCRTSPSTPGGYAASNEGKINQWGQVFVSPFFLRVVERRLDRRPGPLSGSNPTAVESQLASLRGRHVCATFLPGVD